MAPVVCGVPHALRSGEFLLGLDTEKQPRLVLRCGLIRVPVLVPLHFCAVKVNECNKDLATVEPPTSSVLAENLSRIRAA